MSLPTMTSESRELSPSVLARISLGLRAVCNLDVAQIWPVIANRLIPPSGAARVEHTSASIRMPPAGIGFVDRNKLIRATYFGRTRRRWVVRSKGLEQARMASR
jgi:hypothetical protein